MINKLILFLLLVASTGYATLTVTTDGGASNVTATTVSLGLRLTSTNAPTVLHTNFFGWGTSNVGTSIFTYAHIFTNLQTTAFGTIQSNLTGLTANTAYWYCVGARDTNGLVTASSSIAFRTLMQSTITVPINGNTNIVTVTPIGGNTGTLLYNGVEVGTGGGGGSQFDTNKVQAMINSGSVARATLAGYADNATNAVTAQTASNLFYNMVKVTSSNGAVAWYSSPTNWASVQQPYDRVEIGAGVYNLGSNQLVAGTGAILALTNGVKLLGAGGKVQLTQLYSYNNAAGVSLFVSAYSNNIIRGVSLVVSNSNGFFFPLQLAQGPWLVDDCWLQGETDVLGFLTAESFIPTGTVQRCFMRSKWDFQNQFPDKARIDYRDCTFQIDDIYSGQTAQMARWGNSSLQRYINCDFVITTNDKNARVFYIPATSTSSTSEVYNCRFNIAATNALAFFRGLSGIPAKIYGTTFPTNQVSHATNLYNLSDANTLLASLNVSTGMINAAIIPVTNTIDTITTVTAASTNATAGSVNQVGNTATITFPAGGGSYTPTFQDTNIVVTTDGIGIAVLYSSQINPVAGALVTPSVYHGNDLIVCSIFPNLTISNAVTVRFDNFTTSISDMKENVVGFSLITNAVHFFK